MYTSAFARLVALRALFCAIVLPVSGQATVGSISGSVLDPSGAIMPNANIVLVNPAQGAASARQATTNGEGIFVFTPVLPGTYTLTVTMPGFKQYVQPNIVVNVADRIGLPAISLEVGAATESITVEAQAVRLETETAERSGVVTGKQMVDLGLNGRNFTGLLKTVPGVSADQGGGTATINGLRNDQNNFTVDGQTVTDIGVNQQFAYRINVDAIAEFKVSTASQGAEFGRNAGAQIQVVTRSGTKDFHGTGYWFKRGEFMNANNFINNAAGIQRPAYRFMTAGFTAGGPIYIPGKFNTSKDRLFGFMSNEWNRSFTPGAIRQITVPTALERAGDFSQTRDAAGVVQIIRDPTTGQAFPGNVIPASRFNEHGPSVLNWLPMPNISGQPNYNYQSQVASSLPSYDQIYRIDWNINDNWRFYGRHLNSKQTQNNPYGRADSGNNLGISPLYAPTYGWSLAANLVTLLGPTLTNEFQFGYTVNGIPGDAPPAGSPYYRSVSNINIPLLYPNADPIGLVPNFNFGGVPSATPGGTQMTSFAGLPYQNRNPVWNYTDNLTKIAGNHTLKFGLFIETATKTENPFRPVNGTIDFGRDSSNPNDSNWAFSNALLGNFRTYSQFNQLIVASYPYRNVEFYAQDTWKVTKKLTLNYGLRVSFIKPFHDTLGKMANFDYNAYDPAQAVQFYQPVGTGTNRRGQNPFTGEIVPAALIGAIVPGVGDINNGMVLSGQGNTPLGLIENRGAHWGPRIGLAYAFDNKTVFRAGGGVFYDRIATFGIGITSNYVTNPPSLRLAELYYGNLSTIGSGGATNFPTQITRISPDGHVPTVYNYNAGIQRDIGYQTTLEVAYVGSQSRHNYLAQPFNNVPFGSAWQPYSQDPTVPPQFDGTTNLLVNMYRPIPGYSAGNDWTWGGSSNYNALQVSVNRRASTLQYGLAYTWSKALGVNQGHLTDARKANYGPLGLDRTQSLSFNYLYDIPSLANHVNALDNTAGKYVFDGWQLTGITSISSGAPVNVNYNVSGVSAQILNRQITGSEDVAPRPVLTCNPNRPGGDRDLNSFIDTSCFALAPKGSQGMDSGFNRLRGPGLHNWDMSVFKNIPFAENRVRLQLRLEAYNVFNHTQWGSFNGTATFNATTGRIINLPSQLGGTGGRYGFGALNTVRANSQRILQIAVKLYF